MNAPCPPNPACVAPGMSVVVKTFTVSGTYLPSPGLVTAVVECIGGGGGGGLALNYQPTNCIAGGGGGSGGYSRKTLAAPLVAGGVVVTVGAGGNGDFSLGGNGGVTSFGALCVANGGYEGAPDNDVNVFGNGGNGAQPGVGDVAMPGTSGDAGSLSGPSTDAQQGGQGGAMWGGNNVANHTSVGQYLGGLDAWGGTGAGGNGAIINVVPAATITQALGGYGGSGICIVTEYCWAGSEGGGARVGWGWSDECGGGWGGPWAGGMRR